MRLLSQLRDAVLRLGQFVAANPYASSVVVLDVPMQHGKQIVVSHGLGRPARFAVVNPRPAATNPASLTSIAVYAPNPQPAGLDATRQIALVPTFASPGLALVDIVFSSFGATA